MVDKHKQIQNPLEKDFVKYPNVREKFTREQITELKKCANDFMYFATNYVYIQHPTRGKVLFAPYEYQREMLEHFVKYGKVVFLCGRQLGKTTCVSIYILWRAIFKSDQCILIASKDMDGSIEVMDRIKLIYENLPTWMKPGCYEYNKRRARFDNGSEIITRATTRNTGRGFSISLLYVDEMSAIDPISKQRDFWTAIWPTLSTGGDCIVTSTPSSDEDVFAQIWKSANNVFDEFGNPNPDGVGKNGFKAFKATHMAHPDRRTITWINAEIATIGEEKFKREHLCEFISQDETLIDPLVLANLHKGIDPIKKQGSVRWYQDPKPNQTYIVSLDPSTGVGHDSAAIQVYEMPSMVQVAEWKHNRTDANGQVRTLKNILKYIYDTLENHPAQNGPVELFWSIESNTLGTAPIAVIKEMGIENFAGEFVHEPVQRGIGGTKKRTGFYTTNKSKLEACLKLKRLIEKGKIKINSKELVHELKFFISSGASFAAKNGENDDLVMSTVLAIRIMQRVMSFNDEVGENFVESNDEEGYDEPLPFLL